MRCLSARIRKAGCIVVLGCVALVLAAASSGPLAEAGQLGSSGVATLLRSPAWLKPGRGDPQALSPFAIAITWDGRYAFVNSDLSEVVLKIRLSDLAIVGSADLSAFFPVASWLAALDLSERKLFINCGSWRKVLVLDSDSMKVIHTIDGLNPIGMFVSRHSGQLVTWDGGTRVRLVDTDTYAVTEHRNDQVFFKVVRESASDPSLWYVVGTLAGGGTAFSDLVVYQHTTSSVVRTMPLTAHSEAERVFDLEVLPNEQKAYVASLGGWYSGGYHGFGWLYAADLLKAEVKVQPIDGGALCLRASPDGAHLFVGTGWPVPNTNNVLAFDTHTDSQVGVSEIGQGPYGYKFTQINELKLDPNDPSTLYATSCDGNSLLKLRADPLVLQAGRALNSADFSPHYFAPRPDGAQGLVLITRSDAVLELDTVVGAVKGVRHLPGIRGDALMYDVAFKGPDRLLVAQDQFFHEVDPADMRLVATHRPPAGIGAWGFALSRDNKRIYAITEDASNRRRHFLALDATTFQLLGQVVLAGGDFHPRPFETPDGSKLYALGGESWGPVTVHVIDTATYSVRKSLVIDRTDSWGISAGTNHPFAFDDRTGTLYAGATQVILAIDTATDSIKSMIPLRDIVPALGLDGLTYINIIGLVFNPAQSYLYVVHLDQSFISIYDVAARRFLPKAVSLRGFSPGFAFANPSVTKVFTLNMRSDSITVVDVATKRVEKVIDLHEYLPEPRVRRRLRQGP
jgi:YVTN family beta-propeller protein